MNTKKFDKLNFSGREEDWESFAEKFEAYMHLQKLRTVFLNQKKMPIGLSANNQAKFKEKLEDDQYTIYCELIQCLDKKSLMIAKSAKPNGAEAWKKLREKFKSSERPRIHQMLSNLTNLRMKAEENISDYIQRAEETQENLKEVNEGVTEQMLISVILKGLNKDYETFATIYKFNRDNKSFDELKRDLANYGDELKPKERRPISSFQAVQQNRCQNCGRYGHTKRECRNKPSICSNCGKPGHRTDFCRNTNTKETKTDKHIICYNCGKPGHRSTECRAPKQSHTSRYHNNNHKPDYTKTASNFAHDDTIKGFNFHATEAHHTTNDSEEVELLLDSGATNYMIKDRNLFINLNENKKGIASSANDSKSTIEGKGTIQFTALDKENIPHLITLDNAYYVPDYVRNLCSVKKLTQANAKVTFGDSSTVETQEGLQFPIENEDELYVWKGINSTATANTCKADLDTWHKRLGHNNTQAITKLEQHSTGLDISKKTSIQCDTCMTEKAKREPIPNTVSTRATHKLQIVHIDIIGPIQTESVDGYKYALSIVDSYSRFSAIYMLNTRDEAATQMENYICQLGKPQTIVSDNAKEFRYGEFAQLCKTNHIRQEFTADYTPEENGKAERLFSTLMAMARCMLKQAKLSGALWSYAMRAAVHIKNRCMHSAIGKTPYELFFGHIPTVSHIKIFGCRCYAYVEKQKRKKLDSRAERGILLGYSSDSKTYLVGKVKDNKLTLIQSRNVEFNEQQFDALTQPDDIENTNEQDNETNNFEEDEGQYEIAYSQPIDNQVYTPTNNDNTPTTSQDTSFTRENTPIVNGIPISTEENLEDINNDDTTTNTRSTNRNLRQSINPPQYYGFHTEEYALNSQITHDDIPQSIQEAMDNPNWKLAMEDEYKSLTENHVWDLQTLPQNRTIVKGKWCYAIKRDSEGNITRHKARYVAKGYSQVKGKDFEETYSPTVKMTTLRTLIAFAAQQDQHIKQMDIKTAYLNAPISEEVYLQQPPGFEQKDNNGKTLVCKLLKSLYGLKQAGRNWYHTLRDYLISLGFKPTISDSCLFVRQFNGRFQYACIWVDDIIYVSQNQHDAKQFETDMTQRFKVSDISELNWFLGMKIEKTQQGIEITQTKYIEKLLERFGMTDCKGAATVVEEKTTLTKNDCPREGSIEQIEMVNNDYRGLVGSLNYLSHTTRPDLAYISHMLSCFINNPGREHWKAAKHVLRYLKKTQDLKLTYRKHNNTKLIAYSDADWAGNIDTRRSTSGYCFFINDKSGAISWSSKFQQTVSTSTAEAELVALTETSKEALYLTNLIRELNGLQPQETNEPSNSHGDANNYRFIINVDNNSTIHIANNGNNSQQVKHFVIKVKFLQELVGHEKIKLVYCPTADMTADILTKPLNKLKTEYFRTFLLG
jgi:hypothetical protein